MSSFLEEVSFYKQAIDEVNLALEAVDVLNQKQTLNTIKSIYINAIQNHSYLVDKKRHLSKMISEYKSICLHYKRVKSSLVFCSLNPTLECYIKFLSYAAERAQVLKEIFIKEIDEVLPSLV